MTPHPRAELRDKSKAELKALIAEAQAALEAKAVDPLREVLDGCWHLMAGPRGKAIDALTFQLRQKGVTLAHAEPVDEAKAISIVKFAAHEWWRAKAIGGDVREVVISRDGRVSICWKDADESGKYTLPVNFMDTLAHRGARWPGEELRDMIAAAYHAGATDVHRAWEHGLQGAADDLGEGASDYAANVLRAYQTGGDV